MTIKDQIAAARALADATQCGPWQVADGCAYYVETVRGAVVGKGMGEFNERNAAFIAASRTLVPQLATLLERACDVMDAVRVALHSQDDFPDERLGDVYAKVDAFLAGEVRK